MKIKRLTALMAALLVSACMAASVSAADFTPSVVGKDAPSVVTVTTSDGSSAAAIIRDANGKEIGSVALGNLVVTPVSKASEASSPEAAARLQEAYKQVQAAKTLTDLAPEIGTILMQMPGDLSADKLVVRDLFDVSVDEGNPGAAGCRQLDHRQHGGKYCRRQGTGCIAVCRRHLDGD